MSDPSLPDRPKPAARRRALGGQALALAIGVAGGFLGWRLGLPLPWMLGPMIAVTLCVIARVPVRGPNTLRPLVIPVIGVMLGSSITAEVLAAAPRFASTLVLMPPFLVIAATLSYVFYRRVGHYDPITAYYSAMPGGLNDMLIIGAAAGGDERRIALAHASRILVVVSVVVLFFGAWFGARSAGGGAGWTALDDPSLRDYAIFAFCAVAGVWLGRKARLAAASILGPMILSALAHVVGLVTVAPPNLSVIGAQLVIGTVVGCRFLGTPAREIGRDLMLAAGSSTLMLSVAILFATSASALSGIPVAQTFLAYSPGGLTEMGLLAFAVGGDVAFVTVAQVVRITLVIFCAGPIFARFRR